MEGCENDFWTLVCVKIMHVQIFGPVLGAVFAFALVLSCAVMRVYDIFTHQLT